MDGNALVAVASADELAQVIDSANSGVTPIAVELRADIRLTDALPSIEADLTIQGNGHRIDGNGLSDSFKVGDGGRLNIIYVNFINGKQEMNTVISNTGEVDLTNCVFDCRSERSLGSITIYNTIILPWDRKPPSEMKRGEMSLTNCAFLGDPKRNLGVRLENLGVLGLAHCTFDESTNGKSSVIFNGHNLTATHCSFVNNRGAGAGVAITNEGSVNLSDCVLANNVAYEWGGGALINDKGDMHLNRCSLLGNSAARGGGAIVNHKGELQLENCTLMGNTADNNGGAITSFRHTAFLTNCTIAGNRAEARWPAYWPMAAMSGSRMSQWLTTQPRLAAAYTHLMRDIRMGIGLRNSIIAGNQGGDYVGCLDYSVGNLIGDGSCDRSLSGDPMLGELVEPEDGSPAYYPPLPDSPVIDAAHRHFCTDSDQIGRRRPYGWTGDIGAIEYISDD